MSMPDKLAVFSERKPGERRLVELAPAPRPGEAPLVVEFEIPSPVDMAAIEANATNVVRNLRAAQDSLGRYGLEDGKLTDEQLDGMIFYVTAVESAVALWRDWNFALQPLDGSAPVKAPLDLENIARVMKNPRIRAAWNVHLDQASPLERAEGNGSGASLNTSSDGTGEAPNTAGDAQGPTPPAPEVDPASTDDSVPG